MSPENHEKITKQVGQRMAELREQAGLTQAQVAETMGTTLTNYQRIEHGLQNVTIKMLVRVANAIGVKTAEFFAPTNSSRKKTRGRPPKVLQ